MFLELHSVAIKKNTIIIIITPPYTLAAHTLIAHQLWHPLPFEQALAKMRNLKSNRETAFVSNSSQRSFRSAYRFICGALKRHSSVCVCACFKEEAKDPKFILVFACLGRPLDVWGCSQVRDSSSRCANTQSAGILVHMHLPTSIYLMTTTIYSVWSYLLLHGTTQ